MSEWIGVKDRLPTPFVSVLAYIPSEAPLPTVRECYLVDQSRWVCNLICGFYCTDDVTHWMPMPKAPEVSDNE